MPIKNILSNNCYICNSPIKETDKVIFVAEDVVNTAKEAFVLKLI